MNCSADDCTSPRKSLGLCLKHYAQFRRHGTGKPVRVKVRPLCSIDGCGKPHCAHGYCSMHVARFRKHGDAEYVGRYFGDPAKNFWQKVDKGSGDGSCWLWTGALSSRKYGSFNDGSTTTGAHSWAYKNLVGQIPDGYELDHLCHTNDETCVGGDSCLHRRCVNPAHLEPVTAFTNWARGRSPAKDNWLKTHCKNGHELSTDNLYSSKRGRVCRLCSIRNSAAYRDRFRAKKLEQ